MIEVEEEVWIENNEKIRLLKDELLRVAAELRISQEEIKRLKRELVQIKKGGGEEEAETYRVREGESLWKIAKKFYDDAYKWLWIFKANIEQINDPDNIYPDQVLDIPRY
jgi:nucleoid-associated protein YgaU